MPSENEAFVQANELFLTKLSIGALDISEAEANVYRKFPWECFLPTLIRRNADDQFVLTREVAANGDWRRVEGFTTRVPSRLAFRYSWIQVRRIRIVAAQKRSKTLQSPSWNSYPPTEGCRTY